jgi:hypothetical protein
MKKQKAGVIEGPFEKWGIIVPKDMVIIPLVDGEDIYLTKEEFKKIGLKGAIQKYAAQFVK